MRSADTKCYILDFSPQEKRMSLRTNCKVVFILFNKFSILWFDAARVQWWNLHSFQKADIFGTFLLLQFKSHTHSEFLCEKVCSPLRCIWVASLDSNPEAAVAARPQVGNLYSFYSATHIYLSQPSSWPAISPILSTNLYKCRHPS